jgi:hypothetical protein
VSKALHITFALVQYRVSDSQSVVSRKQKVEPNKNEFGSFVIHFAKFCPHARGSPMPKSKMRAGAMAAEPTHVGDVFPHLSGAPLAFVAMVVGDGNEISDLTVSRIWRLVFGCHRPSELSLPSYYCRGRHRIGPHAVGVAFDTDVAG